MFVLCLFLAAGSAVRLWFNMPPGGAWQAVSAAGREIAEGDFLTLTGVVYKKETRIVYEREKIILYINSISFETINGSVMGSGAAVSYGLICETDGEIPPSIGERIRIRGEFSYFSQATNPGEFNSFVYYKILNLGGTVKNAVVIMSDGRASRLKEGLYSLKEYWKDRLYACFPEKEAAIMVTMLLGDKTLLDNEVKDLYKRNGIVHILSISGLHITILGMGLYRLLRKAGCPAAAAALTGGVLLLLYGILTGLAVSACRAIGMFLIRMLGECLKRTYDMMTALGIMLALMLLNRPGYLLHSGFLLSFGSVCGIGLLLPVLSGGKGIKNRLKQSIAASLSIMLFTLPIHLYFYYEIPVYSILLNLLVLPFMSIVMVVGMIILLIPGLGFLAVIDCLILTGYESLCGLFDRLPFHTWTPGCPEIWQIIVYYLILVSLLLTGKRWNSFVKVVLLFLSVIIISLPAPMRTQITFLDVGQGDCICIRTATGDVYLFDGGSSSKSQTGKYIIMPFLKYYGISHIDAVFISHPDTDHCSGILELLAMGRENGLTIGELVLPGIASKERAQEFGELLEAARLAGDVRVSYIAAGNTFHSGEVDFTCLHPPTGYYNSDANAYSQCFLMRCGDFSMLLTGDVQGEGEQLLIKELENRGIEKITMLKVAHHGSDNSTPRELLRELSPQAAVISCGRNNRYGHPREELLERLSEAAGTIYITAGKGAVQVQLKGDDVRNVRINTYLR